MHAFYGVKKENKWHPCTATVLTNCSELFSVLTFRKKWKRNKCRMWIVRDNGGFSIRWNWFVSMADQHFTQKNAYSQLEKTVLGSVATWLKVVRAGNCLCLIWVYLGFEIKFDYTHKTAFLIGLRFILKKNFRTNIVLPTQKATIFNQSDWIHWVWHGIHRIPSTFNGRTTRKYDFII